MSYWMIVGVGRTGSPLSTATGVAVGFCGIGFAALGLWARREVRRALARERIVGPADARKPHASVTTGGAARSLAEVVRQNTVQATGGRTYSETDPYVDAEGNPTPDADSALTNERTGQPVENPDHELWIQSTTLQTALMQAYVSSRLAELTIALGASFALVGMGLAAAGRRR